MTNIIEIHIYNYDVLDLNLTKCVIFNNFYYIISHFRVYTFTLSFCFCFGNEMTNNIIEIHMYNYDVLDLNLNKYVIFNNFYIIN
jgi:hypothetical protein